MGPKVDNVIRVPCTQEDSFFKYWMSFLKPIHGLNNNGINVAACFLKHRHALSKIIQDEYILDRTLLNTDTKRQIREECGLSNANFSIILKDLKTKKVILTNRLNPRFIPKLTEDKGMFQMLILFDFENK